MSRSHIEDLFRAPDVQFIPVGADFRPYETRIAVLEGRLEASREGYNELYKIARAQKERADSLKIVRDLWMDTIRELISMGRCTREEANSIKKRLEAKLSEEERRLIQS